MIKITIELDEHDGIAIAEVAGYAKDCGLQKYLAYYFDLQSLSNKVIEAFERKIDELQRLN